MCFDFHPETMIKRIFWGAPFFLLNPVPLRRPIPRSSRVEGSEIVGGGSGADTLIYPFLIAHPESDCNRVETVWHHLHTRNRKDREMLFCPLSRKKKKNMKYALPGLGKKLFRGKIDGQL